MKTGPAFPLTRRYYQMLRDYFFSAHQYDGIGGYATGSHDITLKAFLGGLAVFAGFVGAFWVLAAIGF